MRETGLDREIAHLKNLLENTAKQHKYNFMHPKVLELSQKLDDLIIKIMKEKNVHFL
jgi:hypothetical protein